MFSEGGGQGTLNRDILRTWTKDRENPNTPMRTFFMPTLLLELQNLEVSCDHSWNHR